MRANEHRTTRADLGTRFLLDPGNVWRIGLVVIALIALVTVVRFVLGEGSSLIFTVVMAWFASLAIEPMTASTPPASWLATPAARSGDRSMLATRSSSA